LAPGCCYNPDPTLPLLNGQVGYKYVVVEHQNGRVLRYQVDLHPHTTIDEAKAIALAEFPPDTSVLWFTVKDTCADMEIQSRTLGKALSAPAIGDPQGQALVELYTAQPSGSAVYDAQNINEGIVMIDSNPTAASAPAC